jgi:AcrR family transcriptional regulator
MTDWYNKEVEMPRPRFHKLPEERRRQILDVAAHHFATDGFAAASLNRILSEAGVSKGAAYYYFDDKADLFATVVEDAIDEVGRDVGLDLERLGGPAMWDELQRLYLRQFELFADRPYVWRAVKASAEVLKDPSGARLRERVEGLMAAMMGVVVEAQRAGRVRDDLPLELLWAMIEGLDGAIDGWFLEHPEVLRDDPALPLRTFAVLRGVLEPPDAGGHP